MPNIEIHGLPQEEARQLRTKIFCLFRDKPYIAETVVTIYPTEVVDKDGNSQPFIRMVNCCQTHNEEILERLKSLGIDIEHSRLEIFIPAQKDST